MSLPSPALQPATLTLVAVVAACTHEPVVRSAADRELDIVGRYLEAQHPPHFTLRRTERLGPSSVVYAVSFTVDGDDLQARYDLWCDRRTSNCRVQGQPALDLRHPTNLSRDLIWAVRQMRRDLDCHDDSVQVRYTSLDGGQLAVRGCGQERNYRVDCTVDGCMIHSWGDDKAIARERAATAEGMRYHECLRSRGVARLEPLDGRADPELVRDQLPALWQAYRAVPGARTAGFGACCLTFEHQDPGWCLRLYVDGVDLDATIAAVAAVRPQMTPRPTILVVLEGDAYAR